MKQEFQMTSEEFEQMKAIAQRPAIPVMKIGSVITGDEKQEDANGLWKRLADKYGFEWDSAEPVSGKDHTHFTAIPKKQ